MNTDKAIVIFKLNKKEFDLEIPLDISAYELVVALNSAFNLNINVSNNRECYLKSKNPIALLRGDKTLLQYGIRNGTQISFNE